MAKSKDKFWNVDLEGKEGTRRVYCQAPTRDAARKIAERQADDIAAQYGTEAYEVVEVKEAA